MNVYRTGPTTTDTMWYHLPIAARFAQTGSLLHIPIVSGGDSLPAFYPHTSELLHTTGIVFLTHDTLTPLLNLFWLATALFAAWCIGRAVRCRGGRPHGSGLRTGWSAVRAVRGGRGPERPPRHRDDTRRDRPAREHLVAAVAPPRCVRRRLGYGTRAGLEVHLVGPAIALTLCVVVFCAADLRVRLGLLWLTGLTVTGVFWYLRNLIAVGNPVPPADVSIGPIDLPHINYPGVSNVSTHLFNGDWSTYLAPGFRYALGPAWWALLGVMIAGLVAGIVLRVDKRVRLIAITGLAGALFFVFIPQVIGVDGDASYFIFNVRYAAIPMALGAIALAAASARYGNACLGRDGDRFRSPASRVAVRREAVALQAQRAA